MRFLRSFQTAVAALVAAVPAFGQFARIGQFSGNASEGFETPTTLGAACVVDRTFFDQADLCTVDGSSKAWITGKWSFACAMLPHGGYLFFGSSGPAVVFTFDSEVARFGGWFGMNHNGPDDGTIRFLGANGAVLHTDQLLVPNDCGWYWNGWDTGGAPVHSIEIASHFGLGGYVMLDDLEADLGPSAVGSSLCSCDGSGLAGPCGNDGAAGRGCGNSVHLEGARLSASGWPSIGDDSLVLHAEELVPGQPALFFQGERAAGNGSGVFFGDGIRCAAGKVFRLEAVPVVGEGAIHSTVAVSGVPGNALAAGDTRYYQLWYRDTDASPCNAGFNLTNALEITWGA